MAAILLTYDESSPQEALNLFARNATAFNPIESRQLRCRFSAFNEASNLCEYWEKRHKSCSFRFYVGTYSKENSFINVWSDPEKRIQANLYAKLGGKMEIITPLGDIDLLTDDQIIEIKTFKNWKAALGQLLVYSKFYPNHQKRLYLFDRKIPSKLALIKDACAEYDVLVDFEIDKGLRHEQ